MGTGFNSGHTDQNGSWDVTEAIGFEGAQLPLLLEFRPMGIGSGRVVVGNQ